MINQFGYNTSIAWIAALLAVTFTAACGSSARTSSPTAADDPNVVASFGGDVLTLEEFERQYVKSSGSRLKAAADSVGAYQDFLERYVNFRLKVAAAEEAGIPDDPELAGEVQSYRAQLARPYLLDQEVLEPIVRELYERRKELVDVSHILVRISQHAPREDTLAAFRSLEAVRDSALQGVDFGDLAIRHSEDPSASAGPGSRGFRGRLGFFTGGHLVEPFETYAYETTLGDVSPIFRTQFGYHVLKVHARRPAPQNIRISHIMIQPERVDSLSAESLVEDLKRQLQNGADFSALAEEYSHDQQSGARGGDLGIVEYTAQLPESFKEAAFELKEIGDVSDVVQTPFGFHLIQLTGREEPATFEESYDDLKALASRLPRTRTAEIELARRIVRQRGGRVDTARVAGAFSGMTPDSLLSVLAARRLSDRAPADTFFVLGDSAYTVRDLVQAADPNAVTSAADTDDVVRQLISSYVTDRAIDIEAAQLEERDSAFRQLMQEFRDGLVLFEFMEDSVWTRAERDSAALLVHYEEHADSYRWSERTRVISLQSDSDSLLEAAAGRLDAGTSIERLADALLEDSVVQLRIDTTLIADSTFAVYDHALGLARGERTDVLPHRGAYVLLVHDGVEPPRRKTFDEARPTVVSEYQQVLEDRLIEQLRRRYSAETFPERLVNAYRDDETNIGSAASVQE